ncbi:hypothetical protein OG883_42915 [Streptomyces sp. NBC_01142]|nr:hypothetical protein [Streptomyces sp. NBC_01142]
MGQRYLPEAELPQSLRGVSRLIVAQGQPGQAAAGLVHRHQQVEQRGQFGTDAAGAVVQEGGEPVGERAAFAEPPAQEFPFEAAACTVEGLGEIGAGRADRGAVGGAATGKGPVLAASRANAPSPHRSVRACPADVSVGPVAGLVLAAAAAAALGLLGVAAAKANLPAVKALVASQTGRVHAALGDEREAERYLGSADELVADGLGQDVPEWVAYFDAAEHAGARAVSARDLAGIGRPRSPASICERSRYSPSGTSRNGPGTSWRWRLRPHANGGAAP